MNIVHWVHTGASGLISTTKVLAKYEARFGHTVELRDPGTNENIEGPHFTDDEIDIHCAHHQLFQRYIKDQKPKFIFLHGEMSYCLSTPGSLEATYNLMAIGDAAISFQEYDSELWRSFGKVHTIRKGVDLEIWKRPEVPIVKATPGIPSILYMEHWHWAKNPIYTMLAIERLQRDYNTEIGLFMIGCPPDQAQRWTTLIQRNRYGFIKGMAGFMPHPELLIPKYDMVVSPVFPSYGIVPMEAIACGVPAVAYDSNPDATFPCRPYDIGDMCRAIKECIENPPKPEDLRAYAEKTFSGEQMAADACEIYEYYLKGYKELK